MRAKRLALLLLCILAFGCGPARQRVVVYCALDREFAEEILREFETETGVQVVVRYDSEANKSVGLYEDLVRERVKPRCDLHWNNEILATLRLQKEGILASYSSPAAETFPKECRAEDHTWTAFAARVRVVIVNKTLLPDKTQWPKSLNDLTAPRWEGQVAIAKPHFGTMASHAACLFSLWGSTEAKTFFHQLRANKVKVLPGNKQVAVAVGKGTMALGLTDTDDALAEIEAGNPVEIIFVNHQEMGSDKLLGALLIPNTVALVKDGPNPENAKKLIDFLLSPEVELKLARAKGKQIPLNPKVKAIELPRPAQVLSLDFSRAAAKWEEAQRFLAQEF